LFFVFVYADRLHLLERWLLVPGGDCGRHRSVLFHKSLNLYFVNVSVWPLTT
jgi:hypothetical protein